MNMSTADEVLGASINHIYDENQNKVVNWLSFGRLKVLSGSVCVLKQTSRLTSCPYRVSVLDTLF